MPRLYPDELISSILNALEEGGASGVLVSPKNQNPRRFVVYAGENVLEAWIYIWTLTHGGGEQRPGNEYRIQITGIEPPLALNSVGPTVMMGYEPNTECFAGFDIERHKKFSTKSPSIQIPITVLHDALQNGLSFFTKGNEEIAIGIRPDQLTLYIINAELLHKQGVDEKTVSFLSKAVALEEIPSKELENIPQERQTIVSKISRLSRDSSFRKRVIVAYDKRCAITRMQLNLNDAAHILPVGIPGSTDDVTNGICLSPTYHRAFDRGLIYLGEDYFVRMNPEKEDELIQRNLSGGLEQFKSHLDSKIHIPQDRKQWPSLEMIREVNKFRDIPI